MKKLSILDLAFLVLETEGSPKHVAGLMLFRKPQGSPQNFARKLVEELKTHDQLSEPFNLVIQFVGLQGPHWRPYENFDIDEHVFYHKPRRKSSWLEVKEFVARLHEPVMDRSKPLWEYHLIDGIEGGRFAVYIKIHHAYADGVTMAKWLGESLTQSSENMQLNPAWTMKARKKKLRKLKAPLLGDTVRTLTKTSWNQVLATGGIAKLAAQHYLERVGMTHGATSVPFSADNDTPLTGSSSPGRSIATTWVAMKDIKRLCKETRSTLNHVALSCIDGALHRYLDDNGAAIDHPITIQMPVNLRSEKATKPGNKVGVVLVELAEPTNDPIERLREVGYKLRNARNQIESVPGDSIEQFSILIATTGELIERLKLSDRLPTHGHTLVSNLPGPKDPLYVKGAKLEQMYPISTLLPGLHMNITLFSCGGILNFGIVATRDLKELDRLAVYIRDEFEKLEGLVYKS